MTGKQYDEWKAYYEREPFGEEVEWIRHGIRAALFANVHRRKGGRKFKPSDFMLDKDSGSASPKKQTVEEQMTAMYALTARIKRDGNPLRTKRNG